MVATRVPREAETVVAVTRRRSPRSRLSTGHLVMVGAGLVGVVLTVALLRQADQREDLAVAARALTPGAVFSEDEITWTAARLGEDVPAVRRSDIERLDGMIVTERVDEGELLSPNDLRPVAAPDGLRAMTFPIDRARAVNGDLEPGDRVDVIYAGDREVAIIVADAEVLDVHDDRGGALDSGLEEFSITLAVNADESQRLTAAVTDGDVMLARSTGALSAADEAPLPISSVSKGSG